MKLLGPSVSKLNPFNDEKIIALALHCLEKRMRYDFGQLKSSHDVKSYLQLHLAAEVNEVFAVLFLNNQHRLTRL